MLDALTLDQMRMFLAVADAGSFRLASMRLGRAQSAVSHAIANLETELKTVLFDRSTRRPTLTSDDGPCWTTVARWFYAPICCARRAGHGQRH
ncbi:LysR family transcriptional regulator [Mesorhizobium sp. WSM3860]|uniref:helix-turn-helix domain-containing protein n=1 Tax=Mesorhizobium sp. WSM3860 TaxID=2029403 RepID=UPI0024780204|nr:LysR family transcriptional regulator [Mesorhizobium sp. WSM3860]